MTGSHEVRGSIPLGSTNTRITKGPLVHQWPFVFCPSFGAGLMRSRLAFKRPYQSGETEDYRYDRDKEVEGRAAFNAAYSTGGDH